jgi:uncharacterized protein (TIGR02147 family)
MESATKPSLPNIFDYNNYRKYLDDYQRARQAIDPSFTKSYVCKRIGLPNTRSFFNSIIKGQDISKTFIGRFITLLELNKEEARFFTVLVKFNQAEDADERELYFDQLISLNRTPKMIVAREAYAYYKNWYNSTVRALLNVYDFSGNYRELARMVVPEITEREARGAVKDLLKLGLIEKNGNGRLKPTSKSIATDPYVKDEMVRQYQLQCLELAKNAVLKNGPLAKDLSTNVLYVSGQGLSRIRKQLNTFRSEVRAIAHKDEHTPDRVYQLDIFLFPNSKVRNP